MISKFELAASCLSAVAEIIRQMETVKGRVRIQKSTYFLKRQKMSELEDVEFFYHHYGPFSRTVAESLLDGERCGALKEEAKSLEEGWQTYEYRLTDAACAKVDKVSPESHALVKRLVNLVREEHWRTLELASTIDFLEQHEQLKRDKALTRALGLKPACKEYEHNALQLLNKLELPTT